MKRLMIIMLALISLMEVSGQQTKPVQVRPATQPRTTVPTQSNLRQPATTVPVKKTTAQPTKTVPVKKTTAQPAKTVPLKTTVQPAKSQPVKITAQSDTVAKPAVKDSLKKVQEQKIDYLGFNFGAGLHILPNKLEMGKFSPGMGGTFYIDYLHFFNGKMGIGTGAGFSFLSAKSVLDGRDVHTDKDRDNADRVRDFRVDYVEWEEHQRLFNIDVPVGFYMRKLTKSQKSEMLMGVGPTFSFPFICNYEVTNGYLETSVYYPEKNLEMKDLPHHGLMKDSTHFEGRAKTKPSFALFLDMGMNHHLKNRTYLFWALYFHYDVTDVAKNHDNMLYDIQHHYVGVVSSDIAKKTSPLTFGLKLGLHFRLGEVEEEPKQVQEKAETMIPETTEDIEEK